MIKKKRKFFSFYLGRFLDLERVSFLFFLFFLAFLVEFLFSYFFIFFYKFPTQGEYFFHTYVYTQRSNQLTVFGRVSKQMPFSPISGKFYGHIYMACVSLRTTHYFLTLAIEYGRFWTRNAVLNSVHYQLSYGALPSYALLFSSFILSFIM